MFVRDKTIKSDIDSIIRQGDEAKLQVPELVRIQELYVKHCIRENSMIDHLIKMKLAKYHARIEGLTFKLEKEKHERSNEELRWMIREILAQNELFKNKASNLLMEVKKIKAGIESTGFIFEKMSQQIEATLILLLDTCKLVDKVQDRSICSNHVKEMNLALVQQADLIALNTEISTSKQDIGLERIELSNLSQQSKELAGKHIDISQSTMDSLVAVNTSISGINNNLLDIEKRLLKVNSTKKEILSLLSSLMDCQETVSSTVFSLLAFRNAEISVKFDEIVVEAVNAYDFSDDEYIDGDFDLEAMSNVNSFFMANELYQSWIKNTLLVSQCADGCVNENDTTLPLKFLSIIYENHLAINQNALNEVKESQDLLAQLINTDSNGYTRISSLLVIHAKEINKQVTLGLISIKK